MPVRDGMRVCDGIIVMILAMTGAGGCANGSGRRTGAFRRLGRRARVCEADSRSSHGSRGSRPIVALDAREASKTSPIPNLQNGNPISSAGRR